MIRTIILCGRVSIQGQLVQHLCDGRIVVAVGAQEFTGFPPAKCPEPARRKACGG